MVSFLECSVFFPAVFCTEQLYCSCIIIFGTFLEKKIPIQTAQFAWAIDFAKWSIFEMVSFFEYSVLFSSFFFAQNNSIVLAESFFACFWKKRHPNCLFAWSTKLGDNFRDRSVVSKFLHGRDDIARCEVVDHNQKEPWDNPGSLWNWFEIRKAIIFQLYTLIYAS